MPFIGEAERSRRHYEQLPLDQWLNVRAVAKEARVSAKSMGKVFLFNVKCGRCVRRVFQRNGNRIILWKRLS